ncbi:hypothetical protein CLV96_2207 [Leptospira meyeri]|uniref:Uncharacterized protein n=1 Tax=Leptospira meyeri TaxID=29508 RepID=A0A4R8MUX6_LEPME|nr:hypothetical protein [Leptospira meyeri]EKJ88248.1 hypothetical protein LEP1GSC017_1796 [Leptospira meyeri serovar Hardjo str. Went 5]MCW7488432.1 hypothetical protein [Leptospira meyeri]TDY73184.1 hypothetical protein CLV96_2207 [Leptospira meyeri]
MKIFLSYITLFLFFFPLYSQTEQGESVIVSEKETSLKPEQNKRKIFSWYNDPTGPRYFSINPGVQFLSSSLTITSPYGKASMAEERNSVDENTSFLYDLKSKEWQLGEYWGLFILNRNAKFRNSRQVIQLTPATDSNSGRENVDLKTQTFGTYSMVLPVLYLGKAGNESFRIGLGMGVGKVNVQGTADFNDGLGLFANAVAFNSGRTLDDKIENLGRFSLLTSGNIDGDPYRAYLLSNLSTGNNLELLGVYSLLKGDLSTGSIEPLSYLIYAGAANGQLSALEIYALSSLGKGRINSKTNLAKSFYFFWEIPLGPVTWRLGFGGPFYTQNNFTVEIRGFEMSLYTPIEF